MQKLFTVIANPASFDLNLSVKYSTLFQKIGLPFFVLIVIGTSLDQWITQQMENLLSSPEGTSPWVWAYGALSLVLNLTYPLLGTLLALSTVNHQKISDFLKAHFSQNMIEELRAWGKAMVWSLVFIIPGLVRFIQYFFVPFVVSLDPAYQRGEKDALNEARRISKGQMLRLFGLFLAFSIAIPAFMTTFDEWRVLWKTPIGALLICFVEMLINLWFIQLLYKLYVRGVAHEPVVSLERN